MRLLIKLSKTIETTAFRWLVKQTHRTIHTSERFSCTNDREKTKTVTEKETKCYNYITIIRIKRWWNQLLSMANANKRTSKQRKLNWNAEKKFRNTRATSHFDWNNETQLILCPSRSTRAIFMSSNALCSLISPLFFARLCLLPCNSDFRLPFVWPALLIGSNVFLFISLFAKHKWIRPTRYHPLMNYLSNCFVKSS